MDDSNVSNALSEINNMSNSQAEQSDKIVKDN